VALYVNPPNKAFLFLHASVSSPAFPQPRPVCCTSALLIFPPNTYSRSLPGTFAGKRWNIAVPFYGKSTDPNVLLSEFRFLKHRPHVTTFFRPPTASRSPRPGCFDNTRPLFAFSAVSFHQQCTLRRRPLLLSRELLTSNIMFIRYGGALS